MILRGFIFTLAITAVDIATGQTAANGILDRTRQISLPGNTADSHNSALTNYLQLPLAFEKRQNSGKDEFVARGQGYNVGILGSKATIGVVAEKGAAARAISIDFDGARKVPAVLGPESPGRVNYILGNDPRKWRLGVVTYETLTFPETYPGIDVVYYGNQRQLEFDLVVKAGADPNAVRMKIGGGEKLSVDSSGALAIGGENSAVRIALPKIYQETGGVRKNISGRYVVRANNEVAFAVDSYDRSRALIIDPTIVYSTLLGGGTNFTGANAIALDSAGNILIAGYTYTADLPTVNAYQSGLNASADGFVSKINAAGSALIYSTYIGGTNFDYLQGIAVDSNGAAWVTGYTGSTDFPLLNSTQSVYGGGSSDAVVAKFSPTGALQFSTYLGGPGQDDGYGIATDGNNAYVTGSTTSANAFPTTAGAVQTSSLSTNFQDGFVTKFTSAGSRAYSTLLSGSSVQYGNGIAADAAGNAYVTGYTYSSNLGGVAGATNKSGDAFVVKLNPTGTAFGYAPVLFGGSNFEFADAIAVDTTGSAYIAGYTYSTDLPVSAGAPQSAIAGGQDGFVAKLNAAGSAFVWATYLGGGRSERINGIAVDSSGNAYVAGYTQSINFPSLSAVQPSFPANGTSLFQTTNGGGLWSAFDGNIPGVISDISVDPTSSSTIIAATDQGIYYSSNSGASWTQKATFGGVSYLARSTGTPATIYAGNNNVYLSTNAGVTFSFVGSVGVGVNGLVADPATSTTAYAFGNSGVYVTTNAGTTWSAANTGLPSNAVQTMVAAGDGSLYVGVSGFGIYKSTNHGTSWTAVNTGALSTLTIYPSQHSLSVSTVNPSTVYFSLYTIYKTTNGGASWSALPTLVPGGSYDAVESPSGTTLLAATSNGTVYDSTDGGTTWLADGTGLTSTSITEIAFDPSNSSRAFVVAQVSNEGFVAKLNSTGTALSYSTYLGGQNATYPYGIAVNAGGDAFVTGYTFSQGSFPVTGNALQSASSQDTAFVTRLSATTSTCVYSVTPTAPTLTGSSQSITFSAVAPSGCSLTASSNQPWATISSGASGTGTSSVNVQIATNTSGSTRTATLTIGGQSITVTQADSSCGFGLSQPNFSLGNTGGSISTNLTTGAGCPWSVTNNYPGAVSITSGASGTGNGTISLTVEPNGGLNSRSLNLNVGTNRISISQAGSCTFVLNPTSASFTSAGGIGSFMVTPSSNACTWNPSINGSFIAITNGFSGTGNGTVNYSVGANAGAAESGAITVGNASFAVTVATGPLAITTNGSLGTYLIGQVTTNLNASGGSGTYTWSLASGTLPPGLNIANNPFSSTVQTGLVGIATTPGNYSFSIKVSDGNTSVTQPFTLKITALTMKDSNLPDAFVNRAFSYTLTPLNNAGSVTFTVTSPALPAGMTLNSTGTLSGTPTTAGTYNINFSIFDGVDTVFRGYQLFVNALNITTPGMLPNAAQGASYTASLSVGGGTSPYSYAITNGGLPGGLSFSNGVISGTINAGPGLYGFAITVNDSAGNTYQKSFSIDVVNVTPSQNQITLGPVDDPVVGNTYGQQIPFCCGGTAPFTWTASGLPPGMSIRYGSGVTSDYIFPGWGEVWGLASTPGTYNVTVTVTDSLGASTSLVFPLHVSVLNLAPFYNLPPGTLNSPYSTTFQIIGGSPAYSVAQVVGGYLPDGLVLNTASAATGNFTVSGTPLENGGFDPEFVISDGAGHTLFRNSYFNINNVGGGININNNSMLGSATTGFYSNQLTACCVANSVWSVVSGNIPGLTLSTAGLLSGTLTTPGTYALLVKAADNAGVAAPGFRLFTLNVTPISITTNSLPYGNVGAAYTRTFTATGGTGNLTWSLAFGNFLPPGLTLAGNGVLSGTPSTSGQYYFNVNVADSAGHTSSRGFGINIYLAGAFPPLGITSSPNLGTFVTGTQQIALNATGGNGTYTWAVVSGPLPPGLSLRTDTPSFFSSSQQAGLIGVATTPGTYTFTLSVTSAGNTVTQATTIRLTALNVKDNAISIPDAFLSTAYSYAFTAVNGAGAVTFTSTNTLPPGMSLSSSGMLSGTPTTAGFYNINFSIFDGVDTVYRGQGLNVYAIDITSPGALPNGTQGSAYSTTLTATGGAGGYVWTANCCLPSGLTLSPAGVISGTITSGPGLSGFTVTATDTNNASYSKTMSINTVGVPIALPEISAFFVNYDATVGNGYGYQINVQSGGTAPFSWTATGLPPGMSIHSGSRVTSGYVVPGNAEIWGIPQAAGVYSVQFSVTDANGVSTTQTLPLHVARLDINPGPASGTIGTPYSSTLRVLGGTGPYTEQPVQGTQLPDGLTFNPSTFVLSGTPLESGNFDLVPQFTDSVSNTITRYLGFNIGNGSNTIGVNNGPNLGTYTVGTSPSFTLSACCVASYTWSVASGTLPTGQTLSSGGVLSGTLTTSGTYTFLVKVTDASNSANVAFRQLIETVTPISISANLPYGNVGSAYSGSFSATGGTGTLTWTLGFGNYLPPGLTLASNGTISGTPTARGQYGFSVTVTDTSGNTLTVGYSLNIYPAGAFPPLSFAVGSNFGTVRLGTNYFGLGANGGNGTYTWNLVSGTLPPGIALRTDVSYFFSANQQAALVGVGTTPGTYNFTLSVTSAGQTISQAFTMKISRLDLQDANLPDGFVNAPFRYAFTPIGNAGAVTFTVNTNSTNRALPPGLTLSSAGVLSGTPTAAGSYQIAMTFFDGVDTQYEQYTLYIYAVDITTPGLLPNGTQNSAYSTNIVASGGAGGYTYTLSGGLPSGLTLSANGTISGTITGGSGLYGFTITATDMNGVSYSKNMGLDVIGLPISLMRITNLIFNDPVIGNHYGSTQNVCCGGTAPFTWTVSGLPPGLTWETSSNSFNQYSSTPGDIEIYGIAQQAGTFNVLYTVTDATGASTSLTVPMHVSVLDVNLPNNYSAYGLPNGTINVPYSATYRVLGGSGPYTATKTVNELPDGLTLNSGTLTVSGTPLEDSLNNYYPGLQFADSGGNTLFRYESLFISGTTSTIGINNNGFYGYYLGTTPVGASYSTQFSACCIPSYVWSVVTGSTLPPGLTLSASGQLSGTPTTSGTYTFLIAVADPSNGANVGVKSFVLVVTPITITTTSLPLGNVGAVYSITLAATGGTGALMWTQTFNSGSQLPPGLTLASNGTISGTPTSAGAYSIIVQATDTSNNIAIRSYTINIYATGATPPLNLPFGPNINSIRTNDNYQLSATGGTPPYHYSLTPGATPIPGMRVQDNGQPMPNGFPAGVGGFLGVLTTVGTFNTSIRVTDSLGTTFDKAITLTVLPQALFNQSTLPKATVGTPYTFALSAGGGSGAYTFTSTNMPAGLTLSAGGQISGTPTAAGTFGFTVTLADASVTGTIGFGQTITVNPFAITDAPVLPQGASGAPYTYTLNAPGCGAGCTWTIFSSSLPAGLALSSAGVISGTPTSTTAVDSSFTVQAAGANGTVQKIFTLILTPSVVQALSISTTITTSSTVGALPATQLSATGGTPPYTFAVQSGSLPPGITLQGPGETLGVLNPGFQYLEGRALTAGTYNFTLQVTDANNITATKGFSWLISPLSIQYTGLPITGTTLVYNAPYSQQMLVVGGSGSYNSFVTAAPIYPGLSVGATTGLISGTPANTGSLSTLWTVTDTSGNTAISNVNINVASTTAATISLGGPGAGTVFGLGGTTTYNLNPSGGTAPYTITALSMLPPGVTLQVIDDPVLTGLPNGSYDLVIVPEVAGTYTFTLEAADSAGNIGVKTYSIIVPDFTSILTTSLPNASVSVPYSKPLYSFGGAPAFALASGSALPPGLSVSPAGLLSGTPTQAGTFIFNLTISDGTGLLTNSYTLIVSPLAIGNPRLLPTAIAGVPYSYTMTATGGTGLTWSATGLPAGLSISSAGVISGTVPLSTGTNRFTPTITVTNGVSPVSLLFTLYTQLPNPAALTPPSSLLADASVGQVYSANLIPSGGTPPYTLSVAAGSTLPAGLSLLSGAGLPSNAAPAVTVIAGTPTTAGQFTFALTTTDSAGASTTASLTLNVSPINVTVVSGAEAATIGTAFSQQLTATGGTGPYTFRISPLSVVIDMLPAGLSMSSTGLISGTPTSTGIYEFRLTVTDSGGNTFTKTVALYSLNSAGTYVSIFNNTFRSVGIGLSQALQASNLLGPAAPAYTWSLSGGALPPGVVIVNTPGSPTLVGAPSAPGTYSYTLRATNTANTADYADHVFTLAVSSMQVVSPVTHGDAVQTLPTAQVGVPYSFTYKIAGGTGPYIFSTFPLYPLPPGLTLSAGGVLSGTPTATGLYSPIIGVTDSTGAATELIADPSLTVAPAGKAAPLNAVANFIQSDLSLGLPAEITLDHLVNGGTPPYTWSLTTGATAGLGVIAGANGVSSYLAGVPTTPGSGTNVLTVSDSGGQSLAVPVSLNVSTLALTPDTIPPAITGTRYALSFFASGGTTPYQLQADPTWDMPPGLSFNSGGALLGKPTVAGNFVIRLLLSDNAGNTLSRFYEITVDNPAGQAPAPNIGQKPINVFYQIGSAAPTAPLQVNTTSGTPAFNAFAAGIAGMTLSATGGTAPGALTLSFSGAPLTTPGTYYGLAAISSAASAKQNDATAVILTVVPAPPCTFAVNPTTASFDFTGGTGSFNLSASSSCPTWTATPSDSSVTITSAASGSGNATINYSIARNNAGQPERFPTIAIGGATFTITEFASAGCSFSINPTVINTTASGGTAQVNVTASNQTSDCLWPTTSGLGATPPANNFGSAQVTVTIPANAIATPVVLTATIAGQTLTVNQTGTSCNTAATTFLSQAGASVGAGASMGSVTLTTPSGCSYNTVQGPSWISVTSGGSGTSAGAAIPVGYSVIPNSTTVARTGVITIDGLSYQVTQQGLACSISLDTSGLGSPFGQAGGTGTIGVNANGSNCAWTVVNNAAFANVSPLSGTGSGSVTVTMRGSNAGASAQSGTITISGQTVSLSQAGVSCATAYNLRSPGGTAPAAGGSGSVGVVAPSACTFTVASSDPWLTATPASSSGTADIQFTAQANTSTTAGRQATLTVTGTGATLTYTLMQPAAPCTFTLAASSAATAFGGVTNATVGFTTGAGCTAIPVSYAAWITPVSAVGANIQYTVQPNVLGSPRMGTIQVGDKLFTVNQQAASGTCVYSLNAYGVAFGQSGGTGNILGSQSASGCATPATSSGQPSIVTLTGAVTGPVNNIFTQPFLVNVFNSATAAVRLATVTFGGQIFTIKQTSF